MFGSGRVKDQFTKTCWLTPGDPRERAKIILKLVFLIRKHFFLKKSRALSNRKKLQKSLRFFSGCTGWQRTR